MNKFKRLKIVNIVYEKGCDFCNICKVYENMLCPYKANCYSVITSLCYLCIRDLGLNKYRYRSFTFTMTSEKTLL